MSNAARITALRKALEWYADRENYDEDHAPIVRGYVSSVFDDGASAKHALNADNKAADTDLKSIRQEAVISDAAPDLLAALKVLVAGGHNPECTTFDRDALGEMCDCGITQAEDAIAKATAD